MISVRPIRNGVMGLLLAAVAPFLFAAEESGRGPVEVESLPSGSAASNSRPSNSGSTASSGDETVEFREPIEEESGDDYGGFESQHQLQLLQQEVLQLRGMVEELSYELERMRATEEDRYLELDGRVQSLQDQINTGGMPAGDDAGGQIGDVPDPSEVVTGEGDEQAMYDTALELIRNRQYEQAIEQLNAVIEAFPEGKLTSNAYYWLGEVHAAKPEPDYEQARQALVQVIDYFPESRKVPDAAFKLGKDYHLMGDCERAKETLSQVARDHSGKSVGNLAESYLADKVDCGG